jgi:hypothetical protein
MERSGDQVQVAMPDFSCADLREADFTGHPLFGIVRNEVPERKFFMREPKFGGANIAKSDMRNTSMYVLKKANDHDLPISWLGGRGVSLGNGEYFDGVFSIDAESPLEKNQSAFSRSLSHIVWSFEGSNWKSAQLPKAITELLIKAGTPEHANPLLKVNGKEPCSPRAPW